jgi:cell division protease FtsH
VVAKLLPKTDPVHKVTIIPRGRALGLTMQLPSEDRYSMDKNRILDTLAVLFGGRIAEELFMNQMTTGASNDFERATAMARRMVTQWGMSESLGTMVYGEEEGMRIVLISRAAFPKRRCRKWIPRFVAS